MIGAQIQHPLTRAARHPAIVKHHGKLGERIEAARAARGLSQHGGRLANDRDSIIAAIDALWSGV
jgi:hypothetical protein